MNISNKEITLTDKALKEAGLVHLSDVCSPSFSGQTYLVPVALRGTNKVLQFIELCGLADFENGEVMKSGTYVTVELSFEAYQAIGKQVTKTIA